MYLCNRMKRGILIIAVIILFTSSVQSQIRLGVKGGVNISHVVFNEDIIDKSNITGFQVGPVLEVMMRNIGLETGVLFSQRGLTVENNGETEDTRSNYIDIPVNFKFKFGSPLLKVYMLGGPYASFLISGDRSIKGIYDTVLSDWKAKTFQMGVSVGAGFEVLRCIQIGANYNWGLTDNYESGDYSSKDRTWSISAAFFF